MADPIDLITADPDISKPDEIEAQLDLFVSQLKSSVPQFNAAVLALNLNDVSDTSTTSNTINLTPGKAFTVSPGKGFLKGGYLVIADNAAPTTNSMVVQIVSYVGTTLTVDPVTIKGSGTKTSWVISFSAEPQLAVVDHEVYVTTADGYGSTNNKIRTYSVTQLSVGTAITLASTAADGVSFTINETGIYTMERVDSPSSGTLTMGFSRNSAELNINVKTIIATDRLGICDVTAPATDFISVTTKLSAGDVIRPHDSTNTGATSGLSNWMRIRKIANL